MMTDYSNMTHDDEVRILKDIINEIGVDAVLAVPEVWEPLRETFNNEILARWENEQV